MGRSARQSVTGRSAFGRPILESLEPRRLLAASLVVQFDPNLESGGNPNHVRTVGSLNLFFAEAGERGVEMWRTDGTPNGTIPLTDLGHTYNPVAYNGLVYFFADGGLWRTDGTPRGTVHVVGERGKPFNFPFGLTVVGDYLLFTDNGSNIIPTTGARLWRTDGTASGTVQLMEATRPTTGGSVDINAGDLNVVGDGSVAVFSLDNGDLGRELWRTDGTVAGTYLLKDLDPFGDAEPRSLKRVGEHVLFYAHSRASRSESPTLGLWKTDGTTEGTVLVRQSFSGSSGAVLGNTMFFTSDASGGGTELWKTDGTEAGTVIVRDVYPGSFDRSARLTESLTITNYGSGGTLWDGGGGGPTSGPNSSNPSNLTVAGGLLYFTATSRHGRELWCSDGTEAGTQRLTDLVPGSGGAYFSDFTAVGDTLFFAAGPYAGTEEQPDWYGAIFKSDGTPEGTVRVLDKLVSPGTLSSVGGSLFFREHGNGWRIMRFDETGVIAGYLFNDTNGDGVRNGHELGLAGWRVFIDKDGDGIRDKGEPTTFTSATGRYRLDLLPRGTFNLRVSQFDADWSATTGTVRPTFAAAGRTSFASLGMADATPALGAVTGRVFDDADLDGAMADDAGDAPVAGARVFLDLDGDGTYGANEPSALTGADGGYRIDGVHVGRYAVRMAPPAGKPGFHFTHGGGDHVIVDDDASFASDFGVHFDPRNGVVHGTVFHDANGSGVHDRGETGFAGLTVYLDANRNRRMDAGERSTVTDATGYFRFTRLKRGSYIVRQVAIPGGEWVANTAPVFVTSLPRSASRTAPFGYQPHGEASVTGLAFNDVNGDGNWDATENGDAGWTAYADLDRDGVRDADEPHSVSNSLGHYRIINLLSGTYLIRFERPNANRTISHGAPAVEVALRPAQQRRLNVGAWLPATVRGTVIHDRGGDGSISGDEGLGGVTVFLDVNHNGRHDPGTDLTTVTLGGNLRGNYRFDNVRPGTYHTIAIPPAGWALTSTTYQRSVVGGAMTYYPSMSVSEGLNVYGRLFRDTDGDGTFTPGDRPLFGYTVYVDADNDGALDNDEIRTVFTPGMFFTLPMVPGGEQVLRFIPRAGETQPVKPGALTIQASRAGLDATEPFIVWFPTVPAV